MVSSHVFYAREEQSPCHPYVISKPIFLVMTKPLLPPCRIARNLAAAGSASEISTRVRMRGAQEILLSTAGSSCSMISVILAFPSSRKYQPCLCGAAEKHGRELSRRAGCRPNNSQSQPTTIAYREIVALTIVAIRSTWPRLTAGSQGSSTRSGQTLSAYARLSQTDIEPCDSR